MESQVKTRPTKRNVAPERSGYTLSQLAEMANVTRQRAAAWVRAGLLKPIDGTNTFGFSEIRLATVLAKFAAHGIKTGRLRLVHDQLRRRFPDFDEVLFQLDLFAGLLIVRDQESRPTAPDGQRLLDLTPSRAGLSEATSVESTVALRLSDSQSAADHFEQAVALEEAGDYEGAAKAYHECLLQDGPDAVTCFNLANVLSASGRTEAAVERYRQAVELNTNYAAAWNNLGLALAELGETDEAIRAWQRGVEADPSLSDALFNLADALQHAGRFEEARPLWTTFLQSDADGEWRDYAYSCLNPAAAR
jgi:tetratricopeptide (TPR) repeat protein